MASLKSNKLTSSNGVLGRYESKPKVYLEGESDWKIYALRWFKDRRERLDFKIPESASGCQAVRACVTQERASGVQAFGILDRDVLQAERMWELLAETDDQIFLSSRPFGEHIRVTLLWELESYLISPTAIEDYLADHQNGREPGGKLGETTAKLLGHAEVLTHHAALNSTLHEFGKEQWGDGRTQRDGEPAFRVKVEAELDKQGDDFRRAYEVHLAKAQTFHPRGTSVEENLKGLLRRVHGKAMLERIKAAEKINSDFIYLLAGKVQERGLPPELVGYIDEFCNSTASPS